MRRILFVDSDPASRPEFEQLLARLGESWAMRLITYPEAVVPALRTGGFDVLVVEMRVAGGGLQLLREAREAAPGVVRVVLSSPANRHRALSASDLAHQFVTRPADPADFAAAIGRALALRDRLANRTLANTVGRLGRLPSVPSVYRRLQAELGSEDPSLAKVARLVAEDPATSAKVLQLVNSAFIGLRNPVNSLSQAVGLLGLNTVSSLVLGTQVFTSFAKSASGKLLIEAEWERAITTAVLAQSIARRQHVSREEAEAAYLGGLLHNSGRLVLAASDPELYAASDTAALDPAEAARIEQDRLGAEHSDIGAYLLSLWRIATDVVEAVAFHRRPRDLPVEHFTPTTAVHVAFALQHELDRNMPAGTFLDHVHLEKIGLEEQLETWTQIVTDHRESTAGDGEGPASSASWG